MDQVLLKNEGTGAVKQFRHVLVPPAFAQLQIWPRELRVGVERDGSLMRDWDLAKGRQPDSARQA